MPKKVVIEDDFPIPVKRKKVVVEDEDDVPVKIPMKIKKVVVEDEDDVPVKIPMKIKKVVVEDEDDLPLPVPMKKDVVLPKSKKVVIEDEDETPGELPPRIPLAHYKPDENLYLIKGTNVVFSYSLAMVIGFVYQSVFIQAPIQEVREVCSRYKLSYLGDILKELDIAREK